MYYNDKDLSRGLIWREGIVLCVQSFWRNFKKSPLLNLEKFTKKRSICTLHLIAETKIALNVKMISL